VPAFVGGRSAIHKRDETWSTSSSDLCADVAKVGARTIVFFMPFVWQHILSLSKLWIVFELLTNHMGCNNIICNFYDNCQCFCSVIYSVSFLIMRHRHAMIELGINTVVHVHVFSREASVGHDLIMLPSCDYAGSFMHAKLLQFHENYRPAYYGTWRKHSSIITARRPWQQDTNFFAYDVDSDEEWEEEEPGESLSHSEVVCQYLSHISLSQFTKRIPGGP